MRLTFLVPQTTKCPSTSYTRIAYYYTCDTAPNYSPCQLSAPTCKSSSRTGQVQTKPQLCLFSSEKANVVALHPALEREALSPWRWCNRYQVQITYVNSDTFISFIKYVHTQMKWAEMHIHICVYQFKSNNPVLTSIKLYIITFQTCSGHFRGYFKVNWYPLNITLKFSKSYSFYSF